MVTVWWSAAHLIHCSFLNPDETSTAEACPANWWDALKTVTPVAGTGQQKRPNSSPRQHPIILCTTNTSKVERTGLQFCLIHHTHLTSHQQTTTSKHLDNLLQRKCFHNQEEAENAFQVPGGQREELRPWQRSWGRKLGIRKGVIKPQETPCSQASTPKPEYFTGSSPP